MKLRNIFSIILSSAVLLAGCVKETSTGSFDNIKLDKTYVSIPAEGGSVKVTLTATESWAFVSEGWPEWLSPASVMSGDAGVYEVTFSAAAAEANNEANLQIKAGKNTQRLRIVQASAGGSGELELSTCADVIAGPDSKTFRVKGTCTAIANTEYGNWYLEDATGSIYIYGTLDANGGAKNFLSLGIEQGDVVEVQGPKLTYGTVVELVDVEVLSITKSLVKVETESATYPKEANEFDVKVSFKGENLSPSVPAEYRSWVSIASYRVVKGEATNAQPSPADTAVVTVSLLPNTGGDRSGSLEFTLGETTVTYEFMQEGEIIECSIAEFNAAPKSDTQYRLTGVVSSVSNAEKGRFYIKDYSGETYVYNMSGFADSGLKEDDIVVLVGKHDEYNGVVEMVSAYVEKSYPVTAVTPTEFLAREDSRDVYYKVTGTITSIANATYGNCYVTDGTSELYIYGVYPGAYPGLNPAGDSRKNFMEAAGIEVGDEISVIGYKATYGETIELCGGIYVSHKKGRDS